jgi:hypothetical protein
MEAGIPVVLEFSDLYREYFCSLLIIWELRDFVATGIVSRWIDGMLEKTTWNTGILESWNDGGPE